MYAPDLAKQKEKLIQLPDNLLLRQCKQEQFNATGKGGQKKNKTATAVRLHIGELLVTYSKSRSLGENTKGALRKMRLALALTWGDITQGEPSFNLPLLLQYVHHEKLRINQSNPAYPLWLSHVTNALVYCQGNTDSLIKLLQITKSQWYKFIQTTYLMKAVQQEIQSHYLEKQDKANQLED